MPAIDTLRTTRTLEAAGFTTPQAEAITSVLADASSHEDEPRTPRRDRHPIGSVDASFIACLFASQLAVAIIIIAILRHARGG